jgi:release factor glutamine methyltransferase
MSTNSSITSSKWLIVATKELAAHNIASASLDSYILLEDCLQLDRAQIMTNPDRKLSAGEVTKLNSLLKRRLKHEPIAYIRGKVEFYNRFFYVDKSVLVPRPESESFINLLRLLSGDRVKRVADIGCGSGCLGIIMALEFPDIEVDLVDISADALEVAKKNADRLGAKVGIIKSNLFEKLEAQYDVIMANLPYVPADELINDDAKFEPELALFSGSDGLNLYRQFWQTIAKSAIPPRYILTESMPSQHSSIKDLANKSNYELINFEGLVQFFSLA